MNANSAGALLEPADRAARKAVIGYQESFIVQAPAGSGKTELLIQRFLNLLANAEIAEPEAILAITFTRKAASEMRNRILSALESASAPPATGDANSLLTHTLAAAALERDRQRGWNILSNPARLQVRTVDSFCESIVRQLPILARFVAGSGISDDPGAAYEQAAEQTLRLLDDRNSAIAAAIENLLLHLDNNLTRARRLLVEMLKQRDQWLPLLGCWKRSDAADLSKFREKLEGALVRAVRLELAETRSRADAALTGKQRAEVIRLASYAAKSLQQSAPENRVALLASLTDLPGVEPDAIQLWLALRDFFLTKSGEFRRRLTGANGFPTGLDGKPTKECCEKLFAALSGSAPGAKLAEALNRLECLPPVAYTETQWGCVRALLVALPLAVAQLKALFVEQGACDFVEVAQAAQEALDPDAPSQLALSLGYRIQHILVDEFQDTSSAQVELLHRLTREWARGDGNTLFLVGDPMQSIYSFRKAEVGLFEDARRGQARLPSLEAKDLTVNFRSAACLVEWFNRVFSEVLRQSNPVTGAVEYKSAEPAKIEATSPSEVDGVHLHAVGKNDRAAEAAVVAAIIEKTRKARPRERIAILVRARKHLPEIVRALAAADPPIPVRAVEIDPLGDRQVVRDLHALTLALTHLADRVAWLALLRSPLCGLTLADLFELCRQDERSTMPQLLQSRGCCLGQDARQRCDRLLQALREALEWRGRSSLRSIVERAWLALGGPAASANPQRDLRDAAAFFELLQECEVAGDLADRLSFEQKLDDLFAPAETDTPGAVEVMTIHKAKGLEWDTVILPGLARPPKQEEQQLLYWRELVTGGEKEWLLAPMDSAGASGDDSVQAYLKRVASDRIREEVKRLLYVACTRARAALHLVTELPEAGKAPHQRSLLALLWAVSDLRTGLEGRREPPITAPSVAPASVPHSVLRRLPLEWQRPGPPPRLEWEGRSDAIATPVEPHTFDWASQLLRHVGTVTHRFLEQIVRDGLERWNADRIRQREPAIRNLLLEFGVAESEVEEALRMVQRALRNSVTDAKGRWILGAHPASGCELELSGVVQNSVVRVNIDRSFVDEQGNRWIIDYKTSELGSKDSAGFVDAQVEKFRPDLCRYRAILASVETRPIRLALYFPLLREWRELH